MSNLSSDDREALVNIIEVIYGHDSQLLSMKDKYTEKTVEVVEKAF